MSTQSFPPHHRRAIWEAYNKKCFYCGEPLSWDGLRIDHVVPEYLNEKPADRITALENLRLPADWDLTCNYNLVAACNPCNKRKGSSLPPVNQAILFLEGARKKASEIDHLIGRFEREQQSDLFRARLEIGLALGALTEAEVAKALAAAANGQNAVPVALLQEFVHGVTFNELHPGAVDELYDKEVRLGENTFRGLTLERPYGGFRHVRTVREYQDAIKNGLYAGTTFDMKMEAFFMLASGIIKALSACRPSMCSYIRIPRVGLCDIDLLPSSLLPRLCIEDDETEFLEANPTIGNLVDGEYARVIKVSSSFIRVEYSGMALHMREILRADLDGDGFEDMLVSYYAYATGGTLGFGNEPMALARRSMEEPFSVTQLVPTMD